MTDPKIGVTLTGGQIQGVAGAGTVVIENFTIYNRPADAAGATGSGGEPIPRCPYPGLAHFGPNDAELFFGRDTAIARLAEAVDRQSFTVLVGASGSGKSSVVLAGLAPRLHHAADWRFSHFRIGTELDHNPLLALARALVPLYVASASDTERLKNTKQLAHSIETNELTLHDVFSDCRRQNESRRILLIADQFEEAFTLVEDETLRRRFIDALLAGFLDTARGRRSEISLILTLRGDFYGQALGYRPFADALQGHIENLGPMSREELRAAIVRPAEKAKVSFEAGLVETLLDNLDNAPGSLPLLQFALREMWQRQEKRKITRKNYDDSGRVERALAQRAETIFATLTENGANPEMENAFRRLFTRLVMPGEGQEDTRRIVERPELGDVVWSLAQRLAEEDNRLVVTNTLPFARETVEVVHEALIRHWPRLVSWVNRDRAFQSWLRQMKPNIDLWAADPADEAPLLRGSMLTQGMDWLAKNHGDLSPAEESFIEASLALEKRDSSERIVLERAKRSLDLSDFTDQAKVDLARMKKLRDFVDLIPMPRFPTWKSVVARHGEALGLDGKIVSEEITELEALTVRATRLRGLAVIASTGAREAAYESVALGGSIFGHYFNEALEGRAAHGGIVTVRDAFEYVREHILTTKEGRQSPIFHTQGNMENYPLIGGLLPQRGSARRALLAATDHYYKDPSIPSLFGEEARIKQIAQSLQIHGGFEVSVLLGNYLTRQTLVAELLNLSKNTGPDDCLLFYFAGHGGLYDPASSSLHLVLADSLARESLTTLELRQVGDFIRRSDSGSAIVVLDTSYAGAGISAFGAM